jgi:hypothetical protein
VNETEAMKAKKMMILTAISVAGSLGGCTEVSLGYPSDEGLVRIIPDWSELSVPGSASCIFFRSGEFSTSYAYGDVSPVSFSVPLPSGTYRMLAYNSDASGVTFSSLRDADSARVSLGSTAQPGEVYVWSGKGLSVLAGDTVEVNTVPRSLVKTLTLHFQLTGLEGSGSLEGLLSGVYPSLLLFTGEPPASAVSAAPQTVVAFSAELSSETKGSSQLSGSSSVRLFGLLDPDNGSSYDNRLKLALRDSSGSSRSAEVGLSGVLTEILAACSGELTVEVPVEISIDLQWTDSALVASVKAWSLGEGSGKV